MQFSFVVLTSALAALTAAAPMPAGVFPREVEAAAFPTGWPKPTGTGFPFPPFPTGI